MEKVQFGASATMVGRLGFGAMGFAGWFGEQSFADHERALHYALERGVNFIDTARAYGESEKVLGKALKSWSGSTRPFVASKVEALAGQPQWGTFVPADKAFPQGQVVASCEASLRELGLDQLDLLQLHTYWPTWGATGHWADEFALLKEQGKIRHCGVSLPDHRSDLGLPLVASGLVDSIQTVINIFDPTAFDALVPLCEKYKVAVIARCILDEGGLTGFLTNNTEFAPDDFRHGYFDKTVPRDVYIEKVELLRRYVPGQASSLAALAIKFALAKPGVTTAITSMHDIGYAGMNIDAAEEQPLSDAIFEVLMRKHRFIKNFSGFKNFGEL